MKLTIIIPVYNERKTIGKIIARVRELPLDKEIIIVDDKSRDGTREIIKKYGTAKDMRVFYHKKNLGKGSAVRTGLRRARGDIVVVQDADLEYDPQDLCKLIQPIKQGKARAVYGSRRLNPENVQHSGFLFYLGGNFLTYLARWLYGIKITDESTCYKMIETKLLRSLNLQCKRFEFCPEVTAKLAKRKISILELPISYRPRGKKEGKKINWRDGLGCAWTLLKYRFKD